MPSTEEVEKKIVEENDRVGTTNLFKTLGLYLKGATVIFRANFSSPEPNDVSYSYYYEFDIEAYKRGIAELREKGECVLIDLRPTYGGELTVSANSRGGAVSFNIPPSENRTSDLYPTSFSSGWTIGQISLSVRRESLTSEQADKVWRAINLARQADDRDPHEVIQDSYHGNELAYLLDMARWLSVQLD